MDGREGGHPAQAPTAGAYGVSSPALLRRLRVVVAEDEAEARDGMAALLATDPRLSVGVLPFVVFCVAFTASTSVRDLLDCPDARGAALTWLLGNCSIAAQRHGFAWSPDESRPRRGRARRSADQKAGASQNE